VAEWHKQQYERQGRLGEASRYASGKLVAGECEGRYSKR